MVDVELHRVVQNALRIDLVRLALQKFGGGAQTTALRQRIAQHVVVKAAKRKLKIEKVLLRVRNRRRLTSGGGGDGGGGRSRRRLIVQQRIEALANVFGIRRHSHATR